MLRSLEIEIGGFHTITRNLEIFVIKKELFFRYYDLTTNEEDRDKNLIYYKESQQWLFEFDKLNIDKWDNSYCDLEIYDGTQWDLKCKFFDRKHKEVQGCNEYPPNWKDFAILINKLVPIIYVE